MPSVTRGSLDLHVDDGKVVAEIVVDLTGETVAFLSGSQFLGLGRIFDQPAVGGFQFTGQVFSLFTGALFVHPDLRSQHHEKDTRGNDDRIHPGCFPGGITRDRKDDGCQQGDVNRPAPEGGQALHGHTGQRDADQPGASGAQCPADAEYQGDLNGEIKDVAYICREMLEDFGIEHPQDDERHPKEHSDHDLGCGKVCCSPGGGDEGEDIPRHHQEDQQGSGLFDR